MPRLRARSVDGHELVLPSFAYAAGRDPLDARTLEAIASGVSTRAVPPGARSAARRAQEHAVVEEQRVAPLRRAHARAAHGVAQPARSTTLDVRVMLIDGLHFRDHVVLLRWASDSQGQKHVLALREGTTENATVCKALLTDLRERGLDLDRAVLFIIDGGTGLRKAIREHCGPTALVQRCQIHKPRNVLEHLPEAMRPRIGRALEEVYALADAALAERPPPATRRRTRTHPPRARRRRSAKASPRRSRSNASA